MLHRASLICLLAVLAGCGGSSGSTPKATPSPTPSPGSAAFLSDMSRLGFAVRYAGTGRVMLDSGNKVCEGFARGLDYGQLAAVWTAKGSLFSAGNIDAVIRSAVRNLCPEQAAKLP